MSDLDYKSITELARNLRKNPTDSERILWQMIRKRQINGMKFLRQRPIIYWEEESKRSFLIADFYCAEKRLIIELDGRIHEKQENYDKQRDIEAAQLGLKVLRIKNEELSDPKAVTEKILAAVAG